MTVRYAQHFSARATPQSEPIPGKSMVANSAGGFAFAVDDFARLGRWLVLGSDGGSYYATEKALTVENASCVLRCLDADAARTVRAIVEVSDAGRAPKNDPAVFALAMAAGHKDPAARKAALRALPKVCRIPTHLFDFWAAVRNFRGRGQGLRKAVAAWYADAPVERLALHVAKYPGRNGWSHRDLLRLVRPGSRIDVEVSGTDAVPPTYDRTREAIYRWAVRGKDGLGPRTIKRGEKTTEYPDVSRHLPPFLAAVDEAKDADEAGVIRLVREHDLPRECVPTRHLNSAAVWEALLDKMPPTAMVRNLGKMSAVGLLEPLSAASKTVADRLGDRDHIRKSRLHPMALLVAQKTYGQGHGDKGKLSWTPVSAVVDALDAAFYLAFDNVEPSGRRTLLALDVSGSMSSPVAGLPLSCREAAAAIAMVTARTEPQHQVVAFTAAASGSTGGRWGGGDPTLTLLDISACSRLSDVVARAAALPMGGTDCSLPMRWATERSIAVDTFVVLTDNETWHGPVHPCQALVRYREKSGMTARLAVVAMSATPFSIADPADAGSLDIVGLDTATPGILADFSAGRI